MIWANPLMPFGPNLFQRLGLAQNAFGPTLGPSFFQGLGLPPINQHPSTYSASISVTYEKYLTKARGRAGQLRSIDGWGAGGRGRCATRSEVAA